MKTLWLGKSELFCHRQYISKSTFQFKLKLFMPQIGKYLSSALCLVKMPATYLPNSTCVTLHNFKWNLCPAVSPSISEEKREETGKRTRQSWLHRLKIFIILGGTAGNPLLCTLNSLRTKNKVLKHFFCLKSSLHTRRMQVPVWQGGKNHCKVQGESASLGCTQGYSK